MKQKELSAAPRQDAGAIRIPGYMETLVIQLIRELKELGAYLRQ